MKSLYLIILISSVFSWNSSLKAATTQTTKNITGAWEGALAVNGTSLRVVFHFEQQSDGSYSGSLDSPDQGATGIHCDNVIINSDSVIVKIIAINGGFKGLLVNDSTINGTWEQFGNTLPLILKKKEVVNLNSSQPSKPTTSDSNWVESEITLKTKTGDLFGTLCLPKKFNTGPVALIIAGSGPTDRDCNSSTGLKSDAFKLLAHQLAGNDIATVRYDKRGVSESKSAMTSESDLRFDNYINDATDWITMLKSDKRFTKIIIIGHSEGSLIGMIAAKKGNADDYISIAGVGESIDKTLKRQLNSLPNNEKDTAYKIIDNLVAGKTVSHVEPTLYSLFRPSVQPYMISWIKYDPAIEISKLTIPVLILQGTNDIQVTVDDAKKLREGNKNAKLVLLKNMNHIFRIVTGDKQANLATYNMPSLPIDPKLVLAISDFINKK